MYARGGGGGEGDVFLESNTEGIIEEEVDGQYCNLLEHTRCPPTVIISSFIVFVVVVVLFILLKIVLENCVDWIRSLFIVNYKR